MTGRTDLDSRLRRIVHWSFFIGLVATAACALGALGWPRLVLRAYLPAFLFVWGLSVGCLGLGLLFRLTGGRWGRAGFPFFEAGFRVLPVVAILFLPIALGLHLLYSWSQDEYFAVFDHVSHRSWYYQEGFFLARSAGYFVLWMVLGIAAAREWGASGLSMVLLVVSVTWAVMDWVMSLDIWFASSILGAIIGMGALATAISYVCIGAALTPGLVEMTTDKPKQTLNDLGNLLLAFVMLWTYMGFSQFLIIWSGNLPDEAAWYVRRSTGGWQWVVVTLFLIGFAVPFAALLFKDLKRHPTRLAIIAVIVLVAGYLSLCWHVLPEFSPYELEINPFAFVTPIATGGLWIAALAKLLQRTEFRGLARESA